MLELETPVVLGLPRGGVVVAAPVADHLGADLDIVVARKLGVPFQPEFGFGAIAERGIQVIDENIVRAVGLSRADIDRVVARCGAGDPESGRRRDRHARQPAPG